MGIVVCIGKYYGKAQWRAAAHEMLLHTCPMFNQNLAIKLISWAAAFRLQLTGYFLSRKGRQCSYVPPVLFFLPLHFSSRVWKKLSRLKYPVLKAVKVNLIMMSCLQTPQSRLSSVHKSIILLCSSHQHFFAWRGLPIAIQWPTARHLLSHFLQGYTEGISGTESDPFSDSEQVGFPRNYSLICLRNLSTVCRLTSMGNTCFGFMLLFAFIHIKSWLMTTCVQHFCMVQSSSSINVSNRMNISKFLIQRGLFIKQFVAKRKKKPTGILQN